MPLRASTLLSIESRANDRIVAIVLAAGKGERFGADKVTLQLEGKPIWRWSFEAFMNHPDVDAVGIVCAEGNLPTIAGQAPEAAFVIAGGASRQESSEIGVRIADGDIVLVHDGARPFVALDTISRVIEGVRAHGAAAPALPLTDTVKQQISGMSGWRTMDRSELRTVQTPQGARRDLLLEALEDARASGVSVTDELSALEAMGAGYVLVEGDPANVKITRPSDYEQATMRLTPTETRTGIGYDVHAFSDDPCGTLMLGGVDFPGHRALDGHSDADALLHAITDAVLGAAGLDDIGHYFPNTDPTWKDRPSLDFVRRARELVQEHGWRIANVDATLIAETPKVGPKREAMRKAISEALGIEPSRVGVKATTNEGLGSLGRGEGIAAFAVATLQRP